MCSRYKSTIIKVISSLCAIIQVALAGTICYFTLVGKAGTSCSTHAYRNKTHSVMESLKLSLAGSKYTCHNLLFFVILFTLSSGLCALMGSSSKSFPFLIPAIIFQILNIIVTTAAIGFSFLGDKYAFDDNLPIFICSIVSFVLCIIFFFVYLCSYNHLRSIARRREKY